ncbi:MAG: hypothetical protein ACYC48_01490 [Minisyncoccota bacterium]
MLSREEKDLLRKMLDYSSPIILQAELFNKTNEKLIYKLISERYIDEIREDLPGSGTLFFYKLASRGYAAFKPWWEKAWSFFTDDFAKVLSIFATALSIVAVIISLTTKK